MRQFNEKKLDLFIAGESLMNDFCSINDIEPPQIHERDFPFGTCAYYRKNNIYITVSKCAHIGRGGPAWSYPGYIIDRTPYGVLQHELGHHVEELNPCIAETMWNESKCEQKITNYCPNISEWFAEHFRLFVTNPHLHKLFRPKTHRLLSKLFTYIEDKSWQEVLNNAPERTITMTKKKIATSINFF